MKLGRYRKQGSGFPAPGADLFADGTASVRLGNSHIRVQSITPGQAFDCLDRLGHRGLFGIKDAAGDGRMQLLVANDCDDSFDPGVTISPDPEANDVLGAGDFTVASHKVVGFDRAHLEAPLGVPEAYNAGCDDRCADPTGVELAAAEPFTIPAAALELAALSCVDLAKASGRTVRLWEARALALHHLAAGDMAEALKVMDAARPRDRRPTTSETNQPPTAAKETR